MRYLRTLFDQLDCFLCAVLGGPEDTTISLRAALARARGKRWGCCVCWWLHQTLRQRHCQRVLDGEPTTGFALLCAACQLAALFAALFYGVPWLFSVAW